MIFSHELQLHLSLVDQRIFYNQHFIPVKRADLPHAGEEQIEGDFSLLLLSDNLPVSHRWWVSQQPLPLAILKLSGTMIVYHCHGTTRKLLSITRGTGEGLACDQKLVKIRVRGQDCLFYLFCNCEDFAFMIHV